MTARRGKEMRERDEKNCGEKEKKRAKRLTGAEDIVWV